MIDVERLIADPAIWIVSESVTGKIGDRHAPYWDESWWERMRTFRTLEYALLGYKVKTRRRPHGVE